MKFHRFKVAKIIRDKSPARMTKKGFRYDTHSVQGQELVQHLKDKLLEEAAEVQETTSQEELIEELADVSEVLHALAKANDIPLEQIEQKRIEKLASRGGFNESIYCDYIDVPIDHPEVKNFRAVPHKYPEMGEVE